MKIPPFFAPFQKQPRYTARPLHRCKSRAEALQFAERLATVSDRFRFNIIQQNNAYTVNEITYNRV